MPIALREDAVGLYLHIPFCERVCHFCAFVTRGFRGERATAFVKDLIAEIRLYREMQALRGRVIETIYVGGGTPTTLTADQLGGILQTCRDAFRVDRAAEITIEANPAGINGPLLEALLRAGCNRLSLGAQSFESDELKSLGSSHTPVQIKMAVRLARQIGFRNLNLDLMYGLPGQSLERLLANIKSAVALEPEHLSFYNLTIEEGTRFARDAEAGHLVLPSHDLVAEMFETGRSTLEAAGYVQYEVSNFARAGFACRHNLGYWTDREWLGLGPSSHSYLDGERVSNVESLEEYHHCLLRETLPVAGREEVNYDLRLREAIAFGLRRVNGVELASLERRYGIAPLKRFRTAIAQARSAGWLEIHGSSLRPTLAGLAFADDLGLAFIE
ncbi:MAG: radical SAM family heme chaperone HemW [Nitrospirota bacterium]